MTRSMRRSFSHLFIFVIVLGLILYLDRPQLNTKTFAWTQVRYQSVSTTLPESRGLCPGLADTSKPALVVARVAADGDTKWLDALANSYYLCVYTADAPLDKTSEYLQVPANRGHEAMAYLTFLIDNYDHIPAAGVVFVHGSRWAWHNDEPDYDNAALLAALNVSAALEPWGYHNLRCDWSASTCMPSSKPQGSLETSMRAVLEPWNARVVSDMALPPALVAIFGDNKQASTRDAGETHLGRTHTLRSQCCAQFVVARHRIRQHSRAEYHALRQWLLDGASDAGANDSFLVQRRDTAPCDDRVAGRILSYMWHILFMQQDTSEIQDSSSYQRDGVDLTQLNALACPRADECYCRLYGRCNLQGCTNPARCRGQYSVPPNFKLPDNWATTHS